MSNPLPPQAARSKNSNPTKQLLEELDDLMQRMLALPVNHLGEDPPAEVSSPRDMEPLPAATATLQPVVEDRAAFPRDQDSPASTRAPEMIGARLVSAHEAAPALPAPHRQLERASPPAPVQQASPAPGPALVSRAGFWPHPALQHAQEAENPPRQNTTRPRPGPPPLPRQSLGTGPLSPQALWPRAGWWVYTLIWSNRTFDHCTFLLGPPGRCLQGRAGRAVLGWLGISLLLGAVAWGLANWFDWTW